ncbi:MAG: glycosyltransferase family 4 protein, partial [Ferruginibacter sp.]
GKWWWGILWHYEKFTHRQANHNFFIQNNDRDYAIANFKLAPARCTTITYGFEHSHVPTPEEKIHARSLICKTHAIKETDRLLLFNGTLGYKPNLDALDTILEKINPLLLAATGFAYKIIICGNKLPSSYAGLVSYQEKNIVYAGFVDDINMYFKGCDIFTNPVIDGGGIKTKIVEALGYDLSVISTKSGAIGIPEEVTGNKIKIIEDNDWITFANSILSLDPATQTPPAFFEHFYWDNIAKKAAGILTA